MQKVMKIFIFLCGVLVGIYTQYEKTINAHAEYYLAHQRGQGLVESLEIENQILLSMVLDKKWDEVKEGLELLLENRLSQNPRFD